MGSTYPGTEQCPYLAVSYQDASFNYSSDYILNTTWGSELIVDNHLIISETAVFADRSTGNTSFEFIERVINLNSFTKTSFYFLLPHDAPPYALSSITIGQNNYAFDGYFLKERYRYNNVPPAKLTLVKNENAEKRILLPIIYSYSNNQLPYNIQSSNDTL